MHVRDRSISRSLAYNTVFARKSAFVVMRHADFFMFKVCCKAASGSLKDVEGMSNSIPAAALFHVWRCKGICPKKKKHMSRSSRN